MNKLYNIIQKVRWAVVVGLIAVLPSMAQTTLEYYWDSDPDVGDGTVLATSDDAASFSNYTLDVSSLSAGMHVLGLRLYNAQTGIVSRHESRFFISSFTSRTTHLEYFVDTDPGIGQGTELAATEETAINLNEVLNLSTLPAGVHELTLRAYADAMQYASYSCTVLVTQAGSNEITAVEYFWDEDPGIGNGTPISVSANDGVLILNESLSTADLNIGTHTLGLRAKVGELWTSTHKALFYVADETLGEIDEVEYFWDNDPGLGKGTKLEVTPATTLNLTTTIPCSSLPTGSHVLGLRAHAGDMWSETHTALVFIPSGLTGELEAFEYFWDEDPGLGMATPLTLNKSQGQATLMTSLDVSALSGGVHRLGFRVKSDGRWYATEYRQFRVGGYGEITALEYYFDDEDPGVGKATPLPMKPSSIVMLNNVNIPIEHLDFSEHTIHIRAMSESGDWSAVETRAFDYIEPDGVLCQITVETSAGGTAVISKEKVYSGRSVTLTVTPDASYVVESVMMNGTDVTAQLKDGVLTVENVVEDITFVVVFRDTVSVPSANDKNDVFYISVSEFAYTGGQPELTIESNYKVTADTKGLETSAGTHTTVLPVTIKGSGWTRNIEVPFTYTINPAPLTVTAVDKTREYGVENPALELTYSGFVGRENADVLTSKPVAATEATISSGVGTYVIDITGGEAANYVLTLVPGTLTITQAPLTITPEDVTIAHHETLPALTCRYEGFRNGDTADVLTAMPEVTITDFGVGDAGTYELVAAGAEAANYAITYGKGKLVITKDQMTLTAKDATRMYGDENPVFEYEYSGITAEELAAYLQTSPVMTTTATAKSDVGTYEITLSGAVCRNYDISYVPGTLTITQAPLKITPKDVSCSYGETIPELTCAYEGFRNGDTEKNLTVMPKVEIVDFGDGSAGAYVLQASGAEAKNYDISYGTGMLYVGNNILVIMPKSTEREYGEENPVFEFEYAGITEDKLAEYLLTAPSATTEATPLSDVGTYAIVAEGAECKNYDIVYKDGTLTVTRAPLTIAAVDTTRLYGDENPELVYTAEGFKNDDTMEVLTEKPVCATDATPLSTVGTYAITVGNGAATNYALSYEGATLTVTQAPLMITPDDVRCAYGEEIPELTCTYEGFRNEDTEDSLTVKPTLEVVELGSAEAGKYEIVAFGAEALNYVISYGKGTLTIGNNVLVIRPKDATRTYGDENPSFEFEYEGITEDELAAYLEQLPTATTEADIRSNVGEYDIVAEGAVCRNYDIEYETGTLTITKAQLTVIANDTVKAYAEEVPELTCRYEGFRNDDDVTSLAVLPVCDTEATAESNVGTYAITVSGGEATNYDFDYVEGMLTIVKADQEIIWEQDFSEIVEGTQIELTATATSGLPVTYVVGAAYTEMLYEQGGMMYFDCISPDEVTIRATQKGDDNYNAAERVTKVINIVSTDIVPAKDAVKSVRYYHADGTQTETLTQGVNIIVTEYESGRVVRTKKYVKY